MQMKSIPLFATLFCAAVSQSTIAQTAAQTDKFEDYKAKFNAKWQTRKNEELARYQAFKKELIEKWGVAELSSNTEYIAYSSDSNVKVIADFANDTIEVSIQSEVIEGLTPKQQDEIIQSAISDALSVTPSQAALESEEFNAPNTFTPQQQPQLSKNKQGISNDDNSTILDYIGVNNKDNLIELISTAQEVPAQQQAQTVITRTESRVTNQLAEVEQFAAREELTSKQNSQANEQITELKNQLDDIAEKKAHITQKNIKSYKIELGRGRFEKAKLFMPDVVKQAKQWDVDQSFLLAIIETESHFNPLAKSHIPAYGLMQIVPSTAGADVNKKIFAIDEKPSPELLYVGHKNIEYGSAYFNILLTHYLAEINNETSRMYCAIAAYNTGIGNLAKAFNNGQRGRKKAINKINQMTPVEVLKFIQKYTHTETQRYVGKVLDSRSFFAQHI